MSRKLSPTQNAANGSGVAGMTIARCVGTVGAAQPDNPKHEVRSTKLETNPNNGKAK
jgi:hypothetical protein